jgi:hypothetical protein
MQLLTVAAIALGNRVDGKMSRWKNEASDASFSVRALQCDPAKRNQKTSGNSPLSTDDEPKNHDTPLGRFLDGRKY